MAGISKVEPIAYGTKQKVCDAPECQDIAKQTIWFWGGILDCLELCDFHTAATVKAYANE